MFQILNINQLSSWLEAQPREYSIIISTRSSLRVLPLVTYDTNYGDLDKNLHLNIFRSLMMSLFCSVNRDENPISSTVYARIFDNADLTRQPIATKSIAFSTKTAGTTRSSKVVKNAINSIKRAASASPAKMKIIYELSFDDALTLYDKKSSQSLIEEPIWIHFDEPDWSKNQWQRMKEYLNLHPNDFWDVWTNWWEERRDGKPYNIEMEREIVLIPDEDWDKGPAHVNPMIAVIRAKYAIQSLPDENRRGLPFGSRDGAISVRASMPSDADNNADLFHAALMDDTAQLTRCLDDCGIVEDPYDVLKASITAMAAALGTCTAETKTPHLWLTVRKMREIQRIDRRTQNTFGINTPPLDIEVGEALRTTLSTFTAFAQQVPKLRELEQANRDNAEVVGISLEAIEPILAMIRSENEKFLDEVRDAFDGLLADTKSELAGIAERGEAVTLASVENLVHRLIAEALAEERKDKPGPFREAYMKKAGEHAADLTLGTLSFGAKAFIAYYFADLVGFTDKLPNADNYRDALEKIIRNAPK